jgi:hypothetical protein
MSTLRKFLLISTLLGGAATHFRAWAGQDVTVPRPVTAEFLAHVREVPFYFEHDPGSPQYLAIVNLGLPVVPELIDLLDRAAYTDHRVPLTGGNYAIGDIAMMAISDIVRDVPWLTFITGPDDPEITEIGFGVYWEYVRASRANRQALKKRTQAWYDQNRSRLIWHSNPDIPSGGIYVLPDEAKRRDG